MEALSYMRIQCPACLSAYDVPDKLLTPPRMVRCARCAHDWTAEPIEAEDVSPSTDTAAEPAAETSEPVLQALDILAAPARSPVPPIRRRDPWLTAAWAASVAALAGLGLAGFTQRDTMMRQWPASKLVYAKLGLMAGQADTPSH